MDEQPKNRDALELAEAYWRDATEYLLRFRTIFYAQERDNQGNKSRRVKAYIDLRTALETALKSRICLAITSDRKRDDIVAELKALRHNIAKLMEASELQPSCELADILNRCNLAPIEWRYEAEVRHARAEDNRNYYSTVGDNPWMIALEKFVASEADSLNHRLKPFDRIVTGADLKNQILGRTE